VLFFAEIAVKNDCTKSYMAQSMPALKYQYNQ